MNFTVVKYVKFECKCLNVGQNKHKEIHTSIIYTYIYIVIDYIHIYDIS